MSTSRRDFIKTVGAAGTAAGIAGIAPANAVAEKDVSRPLLISELNPEHYKVRRKPIRWPNDARIAVTWVVNFEGKTDATNSNDIAATGRH